MSPASWLFVRDAESIWVERPHGMTMIVAGPGPGREQRNFISEATLDAYQATLAERLAKEGWVLFGIDRDRRQAERRKSRRGTTDRRTVAVESS